ncbi:KRAB-A domain-containing protein 2, partial [Trichinella spiralis]|uniref:KRAB-A domain-containing protein 2 n=1 Tax=Trichinella spiralis TaxID=6334 RepID=UPI0001EFC016
MFDVINDVHQKIGHGGEKKTFREAQNKWANVTQEACHLLFTFCEECHKKRARKLPKSLVVKPLVSTNLMSRAQVDLINFQTMPDGDFKYIMTYFNHFTKFCILSPLKSKRAEEVASKLLEIFLTFGAPSILQSDNGREFSNAIIAELKTCWPELKLVTGRPRHPQSQARNIGKALIAAVVGWQDTPDLTMSPGNVVAKPLEHVIAANDANKFIAYNNIPPDIPKVKTKSNSKGVLMMNPQVADEASWIVHTVPGFPKALRGYVLPPEEIQKGHLFICLTIKESEIDAIAMALRIATPLIYHNDIPDAETNSRPNLKKLVNGESRLTPPLTVTRQISTAAAAGLKVTIYSKSEKSKYEIYRKVLVRKLKTSIKVWTTRDNTLKSDCRILGRSIKLVTSPITIGDHASSLESDVSHWLISDPGNKFCAVDKPYHKSQTKEPAIAVCIDDATIFGHFNLIGQNVENCA